ncbi:hypothetical protein ACM55G_00640 [Flavobacterium sp. LB3P122]|uniref:hypothetical protein n=1 Tax=Flavobacterium algoriphilum TaxID=3398738 RepID=UPI003A83BF90
MANSLDIEIKTTIAKVKGHQATIIDNGNYKLAMIPLLGWDKTTINHGFIILVLFSFEMLFVFKYNRLEKIKSHLAKSY